MQQSTRDIIYRRAQRTAALMGVTIDDQLLYRGIDNLLASQGVPQTSEAINQLVYRLVGALIQRQGRSVDTAALKKAVTAAASSDSIRPTSNENIDGAVARLRASGVLVTEDLISRVLVFTEGGARPLTEAQFEQLRDMAMQQQVGVASREIDYQPAAAAQRSAPVSRPGCFGTIMQMPGCLMMGVFYLLALSGVAAAILLLGGAALVASGGDITLLRNVFGSNAEQIANSIGNGMVAVGVVLGAVFLLRKAVQTMLGFATLLIFLAGVAGAALLLTRSGALADILQSLFDQFGIVLG
jgi:hypothetical protein